MLHEVSIPDFRSERGESYPEVVLSYEVAGPPLGAAPLVLVCHALTGNSTVTGDEGWWNKLISEEGAILPTHYTILSFNIPGNAYDGREADDPEAFELRDVARLFLLSLEALGVKEVYAIIGASMGGALTWQIAYLAPTLRIQHASQSALEIARWLQSQPEVAWVNYPGLESDKHHKICDRYLKGGFGCIITFGLKGGYEAAKSFVDNTEIFRIVANLGDTKSLIIHPSSTTHRQLSEEQQRSAGVTPDLVRLSIGLEGIEDLKADLAQALKKATK